MHVTNSDNLDSWITKTTGWGQEIPRKASSHQEQSAYEGDSKGQEYQKSKKWH